MAVNKGLEKLKAVLAQIESGEYRVINGKLFNKAGKLIKGSLGTEDGQVWYNVKGSTVQGQKLLYAYYNGLQALEEGKIVKHLDDNKLNNTAGNLIAVNKKGWTQELATARIGLKTDWVCYLKVSIITPQAEDKVQLNGDELTIAIWNDILAGDSNADIANKYGVKTAKVNDIRRGKSGAKILKKYNLI
jgi:hypothetical protein